MSRAHETDRDDGRPSDLNDPLVEMLVHFRHQNTIANAPYFLRLAHEADARLAVLERLAADAERLQERVDYLLRTDPSEWKSEVIHWLSPEAAA